MRATNGWRLMVGVILLSVPGCGDDGPAGPAPDLTGGVMATFAVSGETFRVWITNPATIAEVLALEAGTSNANIPNGALRDGPGPSDYNEPWTWHLDPMDIDMAEQTVEICDGRPSLVESLREEYFNVGRFCPWGAELVTVDDRR